MDLRVEKPRPGSDSLGEWPWLPRMIDKARATYHGNPGTYAHPCGRDRMLLSQMGLSVEEFREIIERTSADDEVLAEVEALRAEKGAD
ncbi:MAG TPA: DUF5069 domain-containing protein [Thermoleophilia bacterium]|nr:DUF5069 domain-containing protein [Thermoleophilia bacterium]